MLSGTARVTLKIEPEKQGVEEKEGMPGFDLFGPGIEELHGVWLFS